MDHDFLSAFVLLLLVLDPFGSLPIFISVLRGVAPERRRIVAVREVAIAFTVLAVFILFSCLWRPWSSRRQVLAAR